ncbi:transposase [Trueperella pyogenes]|nr:transposase [Trueperella pyogenes]WHU57322.1 transposase [Trueperella pyogenes]
MTTGEFSAHFTEVYGARIFKDTILRISDKVVSEMTDWMARPLDAIYPVIFVDAMVKVREGKIRNTPFVWSWREHGRFVGHPRDLVR